MTDGPRCAHCGSGDIKPMYTLVESGKKVVACRSCGHLLPEAGAIT